MVFKVSIFYTAMSHFTTFVRLKKSCHTFSKFPQLCLSFLFQIKVIWFQNSFPFQGSVAVDKLCLGRRPPPHWAELPPLCTTWLEQCEAKSISETQKIQIHPSIHREIKTTATTTYHLAGAMWSKKYFWDTKNSNTHQHIQGNQNNCQHHAPPGWSNSYQTN